MRPFSSISEYISLNILDILLGLECLYIGLLWSLFLEGVSIIVEGDSRYNTVRCPHPFVKKLGTVRCSLRLLNKKSGGK